MTQNVCNADVVVVGGGIGGLTTAALIARQGRSVVLFERSKQLGGRALTQEESGFRFNLGPHALYRGGIGQQVLRELGVRISGRTPNASGGYAVSRGAKHALPGGLVSLLTTGLLGLSGKLELARLFGSLPNVDAAALAGVTLRAWVDRTARDPGVREFLLALMRLSTYANDAERQCAGAAIGQLQSALRANVLYVDGGWQTLIDELRTAALAAGVRSVTGCKVTAVEHSGEMRGVRLADGSRVRCGTVVVAADPATASMLVGGRSARLCPCAPPVSTSDWSACRVGKRCSPLALIVRSTCPCTRPTPRWHRPGQRRFTRPSTCRAMPCRMLRMTSGNSRVCSTWFSRAGDRRSSRGAFCPA
jgi:phytoene dehydrogenase-like protein